MSASMYKFLSLHAQLPYDARAEELRDIITHDVGKSFS